MENKGNMKIEDAMKRLEEIADVLQNGELELDESLKLYEEGVKLAKECENKLKKAELKFKEISDSGKENGKE